MITVTDTDGPGVEVKLPDSFSGPGWRPSKLHPIEVIDGQHRLWAFEGEQVIGAGYELPVVAFHGLDISWQAYLFWTINIKPKRINASLAFDLYPLLRTEDWLERFEGHSIYRESRSQEIVEALWVHPDSPWHQRINMLGESGLKYPMVTQAAWVRALMATYVRAWEGRKIRIGGLFGAPVGMHDTALPWSRAQQAAFLIFFARCMRDTVRDSSAEWATELRVAANGRENERAGDPAFYGSYTLLATDQGIRGLLHISNDLCYIAAEELKLFGWRTSEDAGATDETAVNKALRSLRDQPVSKFLWEIAKTLADYDWRTSSAPELTEKEQTLKASFRGSGGYKLLRRELLRHLFSTRGLVGRTAKEVASALGYD